MRKENVWVFDILKELGIKYDASIFPAVRDDGGFINLTESRPVKLKFNNYEIKEFPMSMSSFLGNRFTTTGGGYFRFFPYSLIRTLVQKIRLYYDLFSSKRF